MVKTNSPKDTIGCVFKLMEVDVLSARVGDRKKSAMKRKGTIGFLIVSGG